MEKKERRQGIQLHFDQELADWLRQEAARRRASLSQVMRDLIVAEMERRERKDERR